VFEQPEIQEKNLTSITKLLSEDGFYRTKNVPK